MSTTTWTNWGRTSRADPALRIDAATVEQVVGALARAAEEGLTVRPVGAGHSCAALARTDGLLLSTHGLSGVRSVDAARGRITFGAGTRLGDAARAAAQHGLAFENLGDIDRQTLAGAIGTGTHGTGAAFGPIAGRVVGLQLVLPGGEVLELDETHELLPAARVGLGALGVVTAVTMQLVPAFGLAAVERAEPLDAVVDAFAERVRAVDHFEFYWFPGTDVALTKTNTRIPLAACGPERSRVLGFVEDEVLSNGVFELTCRLAKHAPALVPAINRLAAGAVAEREYRAPSHRVFTAPRRVRFAESEWAVPLEALPEAFRAVRSALEASGMRISFPVEVRAVAADPSSWLSTSSEGPTAYLAVQCYFRDVQREYLRLAERVLTGFGGRPHWGKLHTRAAADLRERYPRFDDFLDVRRRLDPQGLLRNPHLDRVLGPL